MRHLKQPYGHTGRRRSTGDVGSYASKKSERKAFLADVNRRLSASAATGSTGRKSISVAHLGRTSRTGRWIAFDAKRRASSPFLMGQNRYIPAAMVACPSVFQTQVLGRICHVTRSSM